MRALRKALHENEEWLMERVRDYALARGYTRYTSTLVSAWRISIVGLSDALARAVDSDAQSLDFGPDDTFQDDPATRFAVREAQLHRERGIPLVMFLGLLKYYRQTYLDLVREKMSARSRAKAMDVVARFFDRVEIGIALEWSACERDALLEELQSANRNLTNEKNKYLTVFESLPLPAFLFDDAARLLQANHAAARWLRLRTPPGLGYYLERSAMADRDAVGIEIAASEILPDLAADILACCGQPSPWVQLERAIRLGDEERYFIVTLGRQLDFSGKFAGVVVTLEDITERRALEQALHLKKELLTETVHRRVRQLEAANARLEREMAQRATLEEALRKGAQFYRAVVEDQEELVCRFTPDCVLTFVNRAYCRFRGKTEAQLLGASFLPFIPDARRGAFLEHLRAITSNSPLQVMEHEALSPDGSVRWQRWSDRGFFDADGNVVEYQSVGSDITDRHQAEEELKRLNAELEQRVRERTRAAEDKAARLELEVRSRMAAEERLRLAYEAGAVQTRVAEAFLTVLGEGLYARVLRVLLEATGSRYGAFGYLNEAGELVAPSMTEDVWAECRVRDKTHRFPRDAWGGGLWSRALREGRMQVKNAPCEVPEGHVPLSCALAAPILFQEAVIGLIVLANRPGGYTEKEENIMEDACRRIAPVLDARLRQEREEAVRRQAEAELRESRTILRQVLDSVPQAIFWKDTSSVYLGCNQAFAAAISLSGPDEVVGKTDYDLPIPRADADAYRADDAQVVASNTPKLHIQEELHQPGGARIWLDTSKTPLLGADRQVRGVLGVFEDITERMLAEEKLRESEEKYRDLFESMNEGACILDAVRDEAGGVADYRVVDVNPAYTAILGVPRERAAGSLVTDLFGLSRPPDLEQYAKVLETGTPATFETAIPELGKDFHVSASRLGPDRFVVMFQDISQRKQAEDALRRRLEMEQILAGVSSQLVGMRYDKVEGSLPELLGIVAESIHAEAGRVCSFDAGGETCLAFWGAEGIAQVDNLCPGRQGGLLSWIMPRLNVFESVVIRRTEDLADEADHVRAALAQTGIRSLLAVPMAKGEDLIGCLAFMTLTAPRDWSSDDVAMIETVGNILANGLESARLERAMAYKERRYFDLIDNLTEGVLFVERGGLIQLANQSMARMLGYDSGELLGTSLTAYMTGEKAQEFSDRFRDRMQGKSDKYPFELVHKDGSRVYVHISASPVRDEQGEVVGSMSLVTDLTKERLLQLQLVQAQRLEAIGQLAAGIAHEINTPTQYVDNNTQFLRGAFEDLMAILREHEALLEKARAVPDLAADVRRVEEVREERQVEALLEDIPGAFDDAGDGLQRISLIVNSVKRFAHPGQSAMQPADLNDALNSTIVVARNEWKYVAEVATELDPGLPLVPCVLSDINQVALNLIVNAAQAIAAAPGRAPEEKGLITVRTRTEGGWAVIEVHDTGSGIPVDIRPRIFDPFFTTKEVGKGTGQGLAIARAVVAEKHHGIITFETEMGKGTTFSVRLPLAQNQGKDEP